MSYILDALQRADAERERGHVPGLNSQRVPPASRRPVQVRRWRPWHVALAIGVGLCAVLALWWWQPPSVPSIPTPAAEPAAAPVSAAPPPTPTPSARPEPVLPILAPPRPEPAPAARTTTAPAKVAAPAEAASAPTAKPATTETASSNPVRTFAELSPEVRAQLPAVNVSGATYSKDAAVRMLIVNGKVVQEGQEIAPGLKLETIGQRSAVLNHQGLRYSIGY